MVGNGGASSGGGDGGSNGLQPQGTEYTLQGTVDIVQWFWGALRGVPGPPLLRHTTYNLST